jgi:TPR repeat protein
MEVGSVTWPRYTVDVDIRRLIIVLCRVACRPPQLSSGPLLSGLFGAALLLSVQTLSAQPLPDSSYVDTHYTLLQLSAMAARGDARAAYLLGTRYASGRGGFRDDSQAVRWFTRAAELELPEAQFNLGVMHATGRGVERSPARAAGWFKLAAEQEFADAQHAIGTLYASGTGVEADANTAVRWLTKAAEQEHTLAQFNLGVIYEFANGVSRSLSRAKKWYQAAADGGYQPAAERLRALRDTMAKAGQSGASSSASVPQSARAKKPTVKTTPIRTRSTKSKITKALMTPILPLAPAKTNVIRKGNLVTKALVPRVNPSPTDPLAPLVGLSDARFTIQVISYLSRDRAASAVRRFKLGDAARIYTKRARGKLWYVVVYGDFESRTTAKKAIEKLPARLRRARPIVRKVAAIRKQLRAQQE